MSVGPLQLVFVGFDGDVLESSVIDELYYATSESSVRLLDLLVVEKDEESVVWTAQLSGETPEGVEEIRYGALLGQVVGLETDDPVATADDGSAEDNVPEGEKLVASANGVWGLTADDVNPLVQSLPVGHSGLLALVELVWAGHLHQATLDAGGAILGQALIEPEGLAVFGEQLTAAIDAVTQLETAKE